MHLMFITTVLMELSPQLSCMHFNMMVEFKSIDIVFCI